MRKGESLLSLHSQYRNTKTLKVYEHLPMVINNCYFFTGCFHPSPIKKVTMGHLSSSTCPNPSCRLHHKAGQGNISIQSVFGKHDDILLLACEECGYTFSENRDTIFARLKIPRKKVAEALVSMSEGNGVRATSRKTGLHRDTVTRIFRLARSIGTDNMPVSWNDALSLQ